MNTVDINKSYSSEHSWSHTPGPSRRASTETIFSIQDRETDIVRDTSDTETTYSSDSDAARDVEYEPVTEAEGEAPLSGDSSGQSDSEIISTRVIEVSVCSEGEVQFADSEQTNQESSDSELEPYDYWRCAQCHAANNNPRYRYCEQCFQVRKNFFPPRPKRKHKQRTKVEPVLAKLEQVPRTLSQDSGVESAGLSQELALPGSQGSGGAAAESHETAENDPLTPEGTSTRNDTEISERNANNVILGRLKRRAESADRGGKRVKIDYSDTESDSESRKSKGADLDIKPLVKTVSDPSISIDEIDSVKLSKKSLLNSLKEKLNSNDNLCIICFSEPKSGVFVHGRIAHICCCYKCAVKVWAKAKRCPVCNCRVSNVLRAVVM